jgi:serine/threonine-protein kinase RsbW
MATPHGVRDALARMRGALSAWSVVPGDQGTAEMVLAEVLNNIVEHAYVDRGNAEFKLFLWRMRGGLRVHVVDDGLPMPGERLPEQRLASLDVGLADLPEGGFGWSLIRQLTEGLCYQRCANENHLRLKIPFDALNDSI